MLPATRCSPSSKISEIIPLAGPAQPLAARGSRPHRRHNADIGIIAVIPTPRHNGDLDDYMKYYKERCRSEHHLARYDGDTIERLNLAA
jgi:hypothetical protein